MESNSQASVLVVAALWTCVVKFAYGVYPYHWNYMSNRRIMYNNYAPYDAGMFNTHVGSPGYFPPVYDPALLHRHQTQHFPGYIPPVVQRPGKIETDCEEDGNYPSAAERLYQRIYGRPYPLAHVVQGSVARFIANEQYFISLIRQKLKKLQFEEQKRKIREQLSGGRMKLSLGNLHFGHLHGGMIMNEGKGPSELDAWCTFIISYINAKVIVFVLLSMILFTPGCKIRSITNLQVQNIDHVNLTGK